MDATTATLVPAQPAQPALAPPGDLTALVTGIRGVLAEELRPLAELVPIVKNTRAMQLNADISPDDPISVLEKENPGLPVTPVLAPAGWVPPSFGAGAVPTVGSFPAAFGISFPQTPASIRTLSLEDLASLSFFYNHTLGLPVGGGGMGSEELLERGRKGLARMCGVAWTSVDAGRGESKGEMEGVQKESAVVAGDAKDKEMGDEKVGANPGTREAQTQEPPRNKRPAPQSRSPDAPVEKKLKPVQHRDLTKDFNVHPPEATATATVQVGGKKVQQTVEEEGEEEKMEGVQKEKNDAGEEGGVAA